MKTSSAGPKTTNGREQLHDRIDHDFKYHQPKEGQPELYVELRSRHRQLAHFIVDNVPPGRELSLALTKLEECMMHCNSGIARHG